MSRRAPGLVFIAFCLAALALRMVLPAGWMPVTTGGDIAISLCSGTSLPGDPAVPANDGDQPCGFALSIGPLLAAVALLLPLLTLPLLPATAPQPVRRHPRRHRPRPPSRGPPVA